MPPKRVPMVSRFMWKRITAAVAPKVTRIAPGIFLAYFRQKIITAIEKMETAVAGMENVFPAWANAFMR